MMIFIGLEFMRMIINPWQSELYYLIIMISNCCKSKNYEMILSIYDKMNMKNINKDYRNRNLSNTIHEEQIFNFLKIYLDSYFSYLRQNLLQNKCRVYFILSFIKGFHFHIMNFFNLIF